MVLKIALPERHGDPIEVESSIDGKTLLKFRDVSALDICARPDALVTARVSAHVDGATITIEDFVQFVARG